MSKLAIFGVVIAVVAVLAYGSFILLGAWIDGRRQAVRERGKHPVTTAIGNVESREAQERNDGE